MLFRSTTGPLVISFRDVSSYLSVLLFVRPYDDDDNIFLISFSTWQSKLFRLFSSFVPSRDQTVVHHSMGKREPVFLFCCFRVTADGRELIQRTKRRKTFLFLFFWRTGRSRRSANRGERERETRLAFHPTRSLLRSLRCCVFCFWSRHFFWVSLPIIFSQSLLSTTGGETHKCLPVIPNRLCDRQKFGNKPTHLERRGHFHV